MLDRWIEIIESLNEQGLVKHDNRFDSIDRFCSWVDEAFSEHSKLYPDLGMYLKVRNWAGGEAALGIIKDYWFILFEFPHYYGLSFPLLDPSHSSGEFVELEHIGEISMTEMIDRPIAIKALEQWLRRGYIDLCPWFLFKDEEYEAEYESE